MKENKRIQQLENSIKIQERAKANLQACLSNPADRVELSDRILRLLRAQLAAEKAAEMPVKTFRNVHFTKRDYECTTVAACQGVAAPDANWVECEESFISGMMPLQIVNNVRFFGWL